MTSPMNNQLAKGVDVRNTRLWHNDIARRVANLERQSGKLATPGGVKMYRGAGIGDTWPGTERVDLTVYDTISVMVHYLGHWTEKKMEISAVPGYFYYVQIGLLWGPSTATVDDLDYAITLNAATDSFVDGTPDNPIYPLVQTFKPAETLIGMAHRYNWRDTETVDETCLRFEPIIMPDEPIDTVKLWARNGTVRPMGWEYDADLFDKLIMGADTSHGFAYQTYIGTAEPNNLWDYAKAVFIKRVALAEGT